MSVDPSLAGIQDAIPEDGTEDVFELPNGTQLKPEEFLKPSEERELVVAMHIGRLTDTFKIYGHTFQLRTLSNKQEKLVGLKTRDYLNTDAYNRAFKVAVVAASLLEVDGDPLYISLSREEDDSSIFDKRVNIVDEWFPLMTDQIYGKFNELEKQLLVLHEKLGKLNG